MVYNAARLEAWYSELANPAVPLSKLAKNIPNIPSSSSVSTSAGVGTYGAASAGSRVSDRPMDKTLDMLLNRSVPLDRAVWFLRSVGAADIQQMSKTSLKLSASAANQPSSNNASATYTSDFTQALLDLVKRQLADLVTPLTHHANLAATFGGRSGISLKGKARNILSEKGPREKWMTRWHWCLALITRAMEESLLDRNKWSSGLFANLKDCHVAHTDWWLAVLTNTALSDILATLHLSKQLAATLLFRLAEDSVPATISASSEREPQLQSAIQVLLRRIWREQPDAFFQPSIGLGGFSVGSRLQNIVVKDGADRRAWMTLIERFENVLARRRGGYGSLAKAEAAAVSSSKASLVDQSASFAERKARRELLAILDEFAPLDRVNKAFEAFFGDSRICKASLRPLGPNPSDMQLSGLDVQSRLMILLDWTVTPFRFGTHRKYLTCSLLKLYVHPADGMRAGLITEHAPSVWHNTFLTWLEGIGKAAAITPSKDSGESVLGLCSSLAQANLLDLGRLLQVVIARGMQSSGGKPEHAFVALLRKLCERSAKPSLRSQASRILELGSDHSSRATTSPDASVKSKICSFLQLPSQAGPPVSLFGLTPESPCEEPNAGETPAKLKALVERLSSEAKAQLREYLQPLLFAKRNWTAHSMFNAVWLCRELDLYAALGELLRAHCGAAELDEILLRTVVLPAIEMNLLHWSAMGMLDNLACHLWRAFQTLSDSGGSVNSLIQPLVALSHAGYLQADTAEELTLQLAIRRGSLNGPTPPAGGDIAEPADIADVGTAERACALAASGLAEPAHYIVQVCLQLTKADDEAALRLYGQYDAEVAGMEAALVDTLQKYTGVDQNELRLRLSDLLSYIGSLVVAGRLDFKAVAVSFLQPVADTFARNSGHEELQDAEMLLQFLHTLLLDDPTTNARQLLSNQACRSSLVDGGIANVALPLLMNIMDLAARLPSLTAPVRAIVDALVSSQEWLCAASIELAEIAQFCINREGHPDQDSDGNSGLALLGDILSAVKLASGLPEQPRPPLSGKQEATPSRSSDIVVFLGDIQQLELRMRIVKAETAREARDFQEMDQESGLASSLDIAQEVVDSLSIHVADTNTQSELLASLPISMHLTVSQFPLMA